MSYLTRGFVAGVTACGAAAVAVAVLHGHIRLAGAFGLLAVAALVTELLEVRSDADALDGAELHAFSFSSGIHLAALMILGPWPAVVIAAGGVLVVDLLRHSPLPRVAFNASSFALATLAAGGLYELAGATPGRLALPRDFLPIGLMALAYLSVNRVLVAIVVSLATRLPLAQLLRDALHSELAAAAGETSVGVTLAFAVLSNPWTVVALAPLAFAVYQAHARLAGMKAETARALETFANVIDERDASTYQHSKRVADLVDELATSLRLPPRDVARLRWAARLHDLGKVAVDASVLRKPGALAPAEWSAIKRHPRLSSRLLRRFRFAAAAVRAVEYHHERFDGRGYYGIEAAEIPLGAHLVTVADSFDAMVAERPYQAGLDVERALAEIERGAGSQFHPVAAKAFVAMQRGEDPRAALDPAERERLRELWLPRPRTLASRVASLRLRAETAAIAGAAEALAAASAGLTWLALPGLLVFAAAPLLLRSRARRRARLADALAGALEAQLPATRFFAYASALAHVAGARWVGLVRRHEDELSGEVEEQLSFGWEPPALGALVSGLVREVEEDDGVVELSAAQLGGRGSYLSVPVRRDGRTVGHVVAAFARVPPSFAPGALAASCERLERLLPEPSTRGRLVPLRATS